MVVSRPSPLGNPATHLRIVETIATVQVETREAALVYYREWLRPRLLTMTSQREEFYFILGLAKRWDIQLLCWCFPKACHADIVKELLEEALHDEVAFFSDIGKVS